MKILYYHFDEIIEYLYLKSINLYNAYVKKMTSLGIIFSCQKHSKMTLHDHLRNTAHFITSTIGTFANFIPDKDSCKIEENYLLPSFPSIRPGDVTLHQNNDSSRTCISTKKE